MTLSDLITRISDDASLSTNVTGVSARLTRSINRVCGEIWDGFLWSFRWRNYSIATDVDYTAGTITLTNGSNTLTGSGTTFIKSHQQGWYVNATTDSPANWYRVGYFNSATQLTIFPAYQGTTGSAKAYLLRHADYILPTEMWDIASVNVTDDYVVVPILEPRSMDIISPIPYLKGYIVAVSIYSSDAMQPGGPTTYTAGTLSGTINTNIITGSGTLWLANIVPGDSISMTISGTTYVYTVRSVDSDTQITLYQQLQVAASAGQAYTMTRQFGRVMRILWPTQFNEVLDIRYARKYWPLVNNSDTNEILYRYPDAISCRVAALELKGRNDQRSSQLLSEAEVQIQRARAEDDSLTHKESYMGIFSYRQDWRNVDRLVR